MTEIQTEGTQQARGTEINLSLYNESVDEVSPQLFLAGVEVGVLVKMTNDEDNVRFDIVASGEADTPDTAEDVADILEGIAQVIRNTLEIPGVTIETSQQALEEDPREGDLEDELDRLDEEADRG